MIEINHDPFYFHLSPAPLAGEGEPPVKRWKGCNLSQIGFLKAQRPCGRLQFLLAQPIPSEMAPPFSLNPTDSLKVNRRDLLEA